MVSQNKDSLFEKRLSKKSNSKNNLYQIRDLINWSELERQALSHIEIKQFGKNRKDHLAMLALLMLQAMHNGSDSFTESELRECLEIKFENFYKDFSTEIYGIILIKSI